MGYKPENHPMYRTSDYETVEGLLGWEIPSGVSPGEAYRRHRSFVNMFLGELKRAGLDARDYLDAQRLVWMLAK
jgi:hypothetical protein